jgi:hypothetical protein
MHNTHTHTHIKLPIPTRRDRTGVGIADDRESTDAFSVESQILRVRLGNEHLEAARLEQAHSSRVAVKIAYTS